jgi:hypothetical protein
MNEVPLPVGPLQPVPRERFHKPLPVGLDHVSVVGWQTFIVLASFRSLRIEASNT